MKSECPICDAEFVCPSCHRKLKSENERHIKVINVANANEVRAADEIKRLEAINAELLEALEGFVGQGRNQLKRCVLKDGCSIEEVKQSISKAQELIKRIRGEQ